MSSYIDVMKARALAAFDQLHAGVEEIVFTDFPDYGNVGDSAIALGQMAYWEQNQIGVKAAYSVQVLPHSVYATRTTVALNGGGSLGGLYGPISEHRYQMAEKLRPDTLLIQEPQSVHFVNDEARSEFARRFAGRHNLRMAVRDNASKDKVADVLSPIMSPDAVHMLGSIPAPAPTDSVTILARRDGERGSDSRPEDSVDWLRDDAVDRIPTWLSNRCNQVPLAKPLFHAPVSRWQAKALRRLKRGVEILAPGEVIVTDRLHAMLIGLQMGREVIAIDNANGKLSAYKETWFDTLPEGARPPLAFASSFDEALWLASE